MFGLYQHCVHKIDVALHAPTNLKRRSFLCSFIKMVWLPPSVSFTQTNTLSYLLQQRLYKSIRYSNSFTPSYSIRNGPIKYLFDNKVSWLATNSTVVRSPHKHTSPLYCEVDGNREVFFRSSMLLSDV